MSKKKEVISHIKKFIKENGNFAIGECNGMECLPSVNEMGKLVALAEHFYENYVEINIYDESSFTSNPIADSYYLPYEELSIELLQEIDIHCENWEAEKLKTEKRISN
jgi:hypothetical protein